MGNALSNMFQDLFRGMPDRKILLLGLDAAGKSTLLYKLKLNETVTTLPTVGFNVETVDVGNLKMTVWDIGGQSKIMALWRYYYPGTQGLVFMVDSQDRDRIDVAREALHTMLEDPYLHNVVVLVLANKQDLPNAMTAHEVKNKMELDKLNRRHTWYIQSCCAPTGDGVHEGFDFLARELRKLPSGVKPLEKSAGEL